MYKEEKIICKKCGKRYQHGQSYNKHIKFSTCNESGVILECENCDKTFTVPYNFKRHVLKCKGKSEVKFCCHLCGIKC